MAVQAMVRVRIMVPVGRWSWAVAAVSKCAANVIRHTIVRLRIMPRPWRIAVLWVIILHPQYIATRLATGQVVYVTCPMAAGATAATTAGTTMTAITSRTIILPIPCITSMTTALAPLPLLP